MTVEEFELKQSKMSDGELINLCQKEVGELASTYGKSHKMTIPPSIKDTDMLLSELIKRFKMLSEAARWRDPKIELPEINSRVLLKSETGYVEARTIRNWHILKSTLNVSIGGKKVIGWRPIE